MAKIRAFITGVGGQDGSYLAELLLEKGYEVFGIVRRNSIPMNQDVRIYDLVNSGDIKTVYGDLLDSHSLIKALKVIKPHEVYNLASQSHVRISFDIPQFTVQTNALGVINILEAVREIVPGARFYQASSSEMFGNSMEDAGGDSYQYEQTSMLPVSPYGCAKLFGYHITRVYRQSYKLFACNGILFNHESPRRATNFVTNKIAHAAVRCALGLQKYLVLGNLDSFRDWGHAKDYVRAMHMILNHFRPDDFVIATGETHSVREFCSLCFKEVGLDYTYYVKFDDPNCVRLNELHYLKGYANKAKVILGWEPLIPFYDIVCEMVQFWKDYYHFGHKGV